MRIFCENKQIWQSTKKLDESDTTRDLQSETPLLDFEGVFKPKYINDKSNTLFPFWFISSFQLIPESHRATVTNWFRVPMNIITCATLLAVNHPSVAADKRSILIIHWYLINYLYLIYCHYLFRSIFATCTGLLITGVVIASKFNNFVSQQKKVK